MYVFSDVPYFSVGGSEVDADLESAVLTIEDLNNRIASLESTIAHLIFHGSPATAAISSQEIAHAGAAVPYQDVYVQISRVL